VLGGTPLRGRKRALRGRTERSPASDAAFSEVGETSLRGRRERPPCSEEPLSGIENAFSEVGETLPRARIDRSGRERAHLATRTRVLADRRS
jgi:hypothetical protein